MRIYTIIYNPVSGRGLAPEALPAIRAFLEEKGLAVDVKQTTVPGCAAQLARDAADAGAECVVVLGGDGTLSEVAVGLIGREIPMIMVSCGTGNDFVRMFHLPKDPLEAVRVQFDHAVARYDLCRVNERAFINVAGTGLDVDVLVKTEKYKARYSGLGAYIRGVRDSVRGYSPKEAMVSVDGGAPEKLRFAVLSLGNGCYNGGGIKAVPGADPGDGKLNLVVVKPFRKWMVPPLFVLYVLGLHVKTHCTSLYRPVEQLVIRQPGMFIQLDGELVPCDEANFRILKGALLLKV